MPNQTNRVRYSQKVALYSAAYKIALAQIPPPQVREQPDISLRVHASIRRQLKAEAIDARTIAFTALKDVLVPNTP
jgi:predicted component of type VI protein secretion system